MLYAAMSVVGWIVLGISAWALVDCALRPAGAFPAADRQTKPAWLIFLTLALVVQLLTEPLSIMGIVAIVVSVFYLADVRSRVLAITRR